jgi:hypothetical protein
MLVDKNSDVYFDLSLGVSLPSDSYPHNQSSAEHKIT